MAHYRTLKNLGQELRLFRRRLLLALVGVLLLVSLLLARLVQLQIVDYDTYRTRSDDNRMQVQPLPPRRGLILDRHGVLLASNRPSYTLAIVPEQVPNLEATLTALQQLVPISANQLERFAYNRRQYRRPYAPIPLYSRLDAHAIARIAVNQHQLPGVRIEAEPIRYYNQHQLFAHALGYVGRINAEEVAQLDAQRYRGSSYIGKLGTEQFYEAELLGQVGYQTVESNARGRILRVLNRHPSVPGQNLTLHLDTQLQRVATEALAATGRPGAVVALDTQSGGILALVSLPDYDPNLFVTGISHAQYAELRNPTTLPLFNRALKGNYPPASTLKPFIGLAGLDQGFVTPDYRRWDPGYYQIQEEGRYYRDWKEDGHGWVNMHKAIVESVDTYFYALAHRMGIDSMHSYLNQFGFGRVTSLDLPEAQAGVLPSRRWKQNARRGAPWFAGDSVNLGIGQGFISATPLQLATASMLLANKGRWRAPRLLKAINNQPIDNWFALGKTAPAAMADIQLQQPELWDFMATAMRDSVDQANGTAHRLSHGLNYSLAGKTGTAQVLGIKQDETYDEATIALQHRDHGLFIGYAPVEAPRIAIAVVVENGGGGSRSAAPVARALLDAYLNQTP